MHLVLSDVVAPALAAALSEALDDPTLYADGRASAGRAARTVKHNQQARAHGRVAQALDHVAKALAAHEVYQAAARPKAVVKMLVSRYEPGMAYGWHVDEPIMAGQRTDMSFTVFLSDPATYAGGDLVLDMAGEDVAYRLPAGSALLYPTGALHQVRPVTRGVRIAVVGWVRSLIRRADQREMLFDLAVAARSVYAREGKSATYDRLAKTKANLIRLWAED